MRHDLRLWFSLNRMKDVSEGLLTSRFWLQQKKVLDLNDLPDVKVTAFIQSLKLQEGGAEQTEGSIYFL